MSTCPRLPLPQVRALIALETVAFHALALAHGGGLNAEGCHNERKTGGYHCHRAPAVAPSAPKQLAAAGGKAAPTPSPPQPQAPVCHVGPRGGTYTITASGRKNYSGC